MVPMDLGIIRPRQPAMGRGCAGVEVRTLVGMEFPSIRSTLACAEDPHGGGYADEVSPIR